MKARLFTLAAAAVIVTGSAGAQSVDPRCTAGVPVEGQDACQKALDFFNYLGPQLGTLIAGGNATLGQGGPLGGFPHFKVGIRANVMNASLPQIDQVTPAVDGAHSDNYTNKDQIVALPQVDAAIGIFKGIPLPITNVGGIDLLLSASYIPSFDADEISIKGGGAQFGAGVRVGILQESLVLPGVSFTILRRDLPKISLHARTDDDSLTVDDFKVKTTAWRVVASKSLLIVGLAAGIGQDRYSTTANLGAIVAPRPPVTLTPTTVGPVAADQTLTRTNMFLDATLNIPLFKIIAEVGRSSGGTVTTYNTFDKDPNDARIYGSVGFRFGF